jgi:hypothetical protein
MAKRKSPMANDAKKISAYALFSPWLLFIFDGTQKLQSQKLQIRYIQHGRWGHCSLARKSKCQI